MLFAGKDIFGNQVGVVADLADQVDDLTDPQIDNGGGDCHNYRDRLHLDGDKSNLTEIF